MTFETSEIPTPSHDTLPGRIAAYDWPSCSTALDANGFAILPDLLSEAACDAAAGLYDDSKTVFRSTVTMARHNFGRGEYKYFDNPLPPIVADLRRLLYPRLAAIANDWSSRLGEATEWPSRHDLFLEACHRAGQFKPTPLLLKYGAGDYNCLHQDLYGDIYFPLQVVVQLTCRGEDFEGGALVLVEQRPRMQSRPMVIDLPKGAAAIIPVRERPFQGARGWRRHQMRHGVSEVTRGTRQTLGLIFHDAA